MVTHQTFRTRRRNMSCNKPSFCATNGPRKLEVRFFRMNLHKAQKVKLSDHFDELWLQHQIEDDPTVLGLGDVVVLTRERRQSSGGRLDFLLHNPETDTLYELEIQLGATDESHIIRTIEYWDIEKRKNPSKEHRVVIAAETITNRFFNVIYLLNRAIPIIALQ